jgi:translation elongation factor EF-Tu-like GTPase
MEKETIENLKLIKTTVLGIEAFAMARPIATGDNIGVLLPEGTDVKRGDIILKDV